MISVYMFKFPLLLSKRYIIRKRGKAFHVNQRHSNEM